VTHPLTVGRFTGDARDWDAFVRLQPGWTHFHLHGWRDVIDEVFGHSTPYLAASDSAGQIIGILPLVRVRSAMFGHYLVSMPFVNYGGPLGSTAAVRALADHAVEMARRDGVRLLELRSRAELPLAMPVSHRKITVLLDLPDSPDLLWKAFDPKLRSQIRRAQKEEIEVRFGSDQVRPFHEVFARHMRDLGTPTQPRRLFESIAARFPDSTWVACAYFEGRPIAGGFGLQWGNELEMTWASSLTAYKRLAPNMVLYWSFMERAIRDGVRVFNFGRCTPNSGTHRFKQQWGSRDVPLWWYGHATGPQAASTPSPTDAAYAWGPRLWRRLPLSVASVLGPRIVRAIP
jgi:FemAB-related protein (PEP-CTERM system-associated)